MITWATWNEPAELGPLTEDTDGNLVARVNVYQTRIRGSERSESIVFTGKMALALGPAS